MFSSLHTGQLQFSLSTFEAGRLSDVREQAFEAFKREHHSAKHIETQKSELRSLYAEAKNHAKEMCLARNEVAQMQKKLNDLSHNETSSQSFRSNEYEALRSTIDAKRTAYSAAYSKLKELRPRIEHLQRALETAKVRLVQDFELWWQNQSPSSRQVALLETTAAVETAQTKEPVGDRKTGCGVRQSASSLVVNTGQPEQLDNNRLDVKGAESYFGKIPLTGDPAVDADILAFVHAREELRRRQTEQENQ